MEVLPNEGRTTVRSRAARPSLLVFPLLHVLLSRPSQLRQWAQDLKENKRRLLDTLSGTSPSEAPFTAVRVVPACNAEKEAPRQHQVQRQHHGHHRDSSP